MASINSLSQIEFGHGAIKSLGTALQGMNIRRPLIVTDRGIRSSGLLDTILGQLVDRDNVAIFDETPQNPTEDAALAALAAIVAAGGGSPIDLGKASAHLVARWA